MIVAHKRFKFSGQLLDLNNSTSVSPHTYVDVFLSRWTRDAHRVARHVNHRLVRLQKSTPKCPSIVWTVYYVQFCSLGFPLYLHKDLNLSKDLIVKIIN